MIIRHDWIADTPTPAKPQDIRPLRVVRGRGSPLAAESIQVAEDSPRVAYKDLLDRSLAAVALILFLPVMALLCLLIKLTSRGPAFHLQDRVGKNGKVFRIIKLRTMVQDAERATGPVWASANDPRITSVGRLLRKTHLDEVPQLLNVLQGHMSLVGPRPERPVFVEKFEQLIPGYRERLRVKPGITGLAQINHHYDVTLQDVRTKLAYDRLYLKKVGLWTDLSLLVSTVPCLFRDFARLPPRPSTPPDALDAPRPAALSHPGESSVQQAARCSRGSHPEGVPIK